MAYLILICGVFCCSTSVLFIKGSETDPTWLSAYRLLLGGVLLLPAVWRARLRHPEFAYRGRWKGIWIPSVFLAVHFISWIAGARMTPGANASLLVNMTPAVMPFVLYLLVREVLTRAEWIGTGLAMVGLLILGWGDFSFSARYALGDAVCFGSMMLYAGYLGFGSRNRGFPSIYLYVVPVYLLAGVICLALAGIHGVLAGSPAWIGPRVGRELLMIVGLAVVPTLLGHSIVNWSFKVFRGQVVSLLVLGQFIFAGITTYLILDETPSPAFFGAVCFVVAGMVLVVLQGRRN